MKYLSAFAIIFLLAATGLRAQNRETFFKTVPPPGEPMPEWARLMYSPDPNVKQVDFEFGKYFEAHPFEKSIHTQNYRHWRRVVESWISPEGFIRQPDPAAEQAMLAKLGKRGRMKTGGDFTWRSIGPFDTRANDASPAKGVSWQVNVYCFDQSESRPDILYAGTEAGGLFKSYNRGRSWQLASASVPVATVTDVKVSAINPDLVFMSANNRIYKTTDGGESWTEKYLVGDEIFQLLIHPANPDIVFCAANNGLFRSENGGDTWTRLYSQRCWDIKFHPVSPAIVYLAKSNPTAKKVEFWKSTDTGLTFTLKSTGWYVPASLANAKDDGAKIGVTPAAPEKVYVGLIGQSKSGDNGWIGLYQSQDGGENWSNPNPPDGGPYSESHPNVASQNRNGTGIYQGFFDFAMAVSPVNPDKVWLGVMALSVTSDGGRTWKRIGSYDANYDIGWIHPDIQDLHVRANDIFLTTDGGVNYSTDELRTHEARNQGLAGSDYWGFGQGWNEDVIVGGRYHNGNSGFYESYGEGNTLRLGGAEAPTGYVDPLENRKTYFSDISSVLLPERYDGAVVYFGKLGKYPLENYTESYSSEIEWDPRYSGHMYLGSGGKVWKSVNGGGYFEAIASFGTSQVLEIEVSRANPDILYCVYQPKGGYWDPCSVRKSTDGGKTWTATTAVPTNDRWRLEITLNPENPDELWVISVNGSNGRKVYRTTDGGKTWESKNSSLFDGERPFDIQFQGGTDGVVYLATDQGAYYYDPAAMAWVEWMNGLPAWTRAMEMKPYYNGGKIRLATGGRGIWENDLVVASRPLAQPMTRVGVIYSAKDTVRFDSYSIVRNEGASWQWTFSPEPQWVSSKTVRNPKVVFGDMGSYDVTLTVTDAGGRTSTKTVPAMVTVSGLPGPEALAGNAMECNSDGDFASTGPINLTTNVMTITAWVKPNGIQPDYSGIVMNNGAGAGFNFRGGNNTLGYHWPGGSWGWDSRLVVPAGKWSHVAMVADGTSMTLYVNGIPSKHTTALQNADLTTMYIGSYMGWESRNFKGQIDEVCIWKRALTASEIRESSHLTKEKFTEDASFIGYYQFNESGGDLYNRAGSGFGTLIGSPARITSTAPVGEGTSFRMQVNGGGSYDFTGTGLALTFQSGGALYPGETVVTRLNGVPAYLPNANQNTGCWWLIDGYGSDHFTPVTELKFTPPEGEPSDTIIKSPGHAKLHFRRSGESGNTWENPCQAVSVTAGNPGMFRYNTLCGIGINGSVILATDDPLVPLFKGGSTGISNPEDPGEAFVRIYPNPVEQGSALRVDYPGQGSVRIRVYDAAGKTLADLRRQGPCAEIISTAAFGRGVVFYRVESDTKMRNGRIVIR